MSRKDCVFRNTWKLLAYIIRVLRRSALSLDGKSNPDDLGRCIGNAQHGNCRAGIHGEVGTPNYQTIGEKDG